jgi:hypothetical protein
LPTFSGNPSGVLAGCGTAGIPSLIISTCRGIEDEATGGEDQADQAALELPAAENSTADETVGGDSYLGKWHPEDATVEVWSQSAENTSSLVELSLKENLIRFRSHSQDGTRKFFVLPEDESRAREIVREIRVSVPPELNRTRWDHLAARHQGPRDSFELVVLLDVRMRAVEHEAFD